MPPATGRQFWEALHSYAWHYPGDPTAEDRRAAREWLAEWSQRIPRYGCPCHDEWQHIARLCPPDLTSRESFYWWTVAAHDRINRRLGKPLAAPAWSLRHPLLNKP